MSVKQTGVCNLCAAGCGFHLLKLACPLSAVSPVGDGGDLEPRLRVGREPWEDHWIPEGNCSSGTLALAVGYVVWCWPLLWGTWHGTWHPGALAGMQ